MTLSGPFIFRPIGTTLIALGMTLGGLIGFILLPVAALPQVDFPTIQIQTTLPGASPEIMATSVATPLERQLSRVAGITEMTSVSSLGTTRITVQFDLNRNIDGAARDIQGAINAAASNLPQDLPINPTYKKVNPADSPIMILTLTSKSYSPGQIYDAASTILQQKLSQVEGVGQVLVGGGALPAVRIELIPHILNQYGISLEDVRKSVQISNRTLPKGLLSGDHHAWDIVTNDQMFKSHEYAPLIVSYKNNRPVRLSELGDVVDSVEDLHTMGLSNGKRCIVMVIFRQPGANVIQTVNNVRDALPFLKAAMPVDIKITEVMNRTTTILAALKDVEMTLLLSTLLVIGVIFLFLKSPTASLIPSLVIPLTLLGTFGIIYLLGFSLNTFSLMAMTIATGFVVDDAVVVVENISRHLEKGLNPLRAALKGAKEIGFTVISMSFSLIAVFIPILLMSGIVGRLFREFAVTLSIAIILSMIVSLTITPMMSARLLKKPDFEKKPSFLLPKLLSGYQTTLRWSLTHPGLILSLLLATIVLNVGLMVYSSKGFFPLQDTGRLIASLQESQDISHDALKKKLAAYVHVFQSDPAVEYATGFIGGSGTIANAGNIYITLKPLDVRKISMEKVMERLKGSLDTLQNSRIFLRPAQDVMVGGRQSNALYQYTLTAPTLDLLNEWAPKILEDMKKIPGITDLNSDQLSHGLEMMVTVDRDKAATYGITSQNIDNILYDAFGQRQISTLYTTLNQYHVVMEVAPSYQKDPESLKDIYVSAASGKMVPLSTFASFKSSQTLLAVNHQGLFPATTLSFNLKPGYALGDVVTSIEKMMAKLHAGQDSVHGSFQGTAQAFQDATSGMIYLIITAILTVYIVLGILYESWIHPITILSTLPSAGVGALLALMFFGKDLSIIAVIGVILLIGIVKKNAIIMIDFALELQRLQKKSALEAILEASLLRFRPIMMTTMAALLGAVPLAFGTGIGSEFRQPLGIAIIGGLILSQLLTLYTTPIIYLKLDTCLNIFKNKRFLKGPHLSIE